MNIGENIRLIRLKKGLSQEKVADFLSISTTAYGYIERNKSEITVSRLLKICKVLEVDFSEILENIAPSPSNKDQINLLKAELILSNIESLKWKERFMRSVFADNQNNSFKNRPKIGFK